MPRSSLHPPQHDLYVRTRYAWAVLVALLIWGALAIPFFRGQVYAFDDLGAFHLPTRYFYAQCLAAGDKFDWFPQFFNGFYLSGEGQAGMYHPVHFALYRGLNFQAAFCLELLISYPLMYLGFYCFLRRQELDRAAAAFGSLLFTFCGFNLLHFMHVNAIAIVAHIPWLLYAWDVALLDRRPRRVALAEAAIALLTASQLLLGYPQYVWFSLLAELWYVTFILLARKPDWRFPWSCCAAKILGVLLGAVQLLPTADLLFASTRGQPNPDLPFTGSLAPGNVVQLLAPYLFNHRVIGGNTHEFGLYLGAVPLVLALWWIGGRDDRSTAGSLALGACVLAVLALLLAFGRYGPLYTLQTWLPLVGKFRFPSRYIVLLELATTIVAAVAFAELGRSSTIDPRTIVRRSLILWIAVGVSFALALFVPRDWHGERTAPLLARLLGPGLLLAAVIFVLLAATGRRWAMVAIVLLAGLDLAAYGMSYSVFGHSRTLDQLVAIKQLPPGDPSHARIHGHERGAKLISPAVCRLTMAGWRLVDGYAALAPQRQLDYQAAAGLRIAGVKWVRRNNLTPPEPGLYPFSEQWWEVSQPLPRARFVTHAFVSSDPRGEIGRIPLETAALVDRDLRLTAGTSGQAEIYVDRPGAIRVATQSDGRGLLVLSEGYHPGWHVAIDGQRQPLERVNGDFLGAVVDAGKHDVRFEFRPVSLTCGRGISLLSLVLLAGWITARLAWNTMTDTRQASCQ